MMMLAGGKKASNGLVEKERPNLYITMEMRIIFLVSLNYFMSCSLYPVAVYLSPLQLFVGSLSSLIKTVAHQANIGGFKTNHSLRATRLYWQNTD